MSWDSSGSFLVQNFRKTSTLSRAHDGLNRALKLLNSGWEFIPYKSSYQKANSWPPLRILRMKLWKVNQSNDTLIPALPNNKQWTKTWLRCLPGSYPLTQMTATGKIHSRAWHLSLAAVRAEWPQVLLPTMKCTWEGEGKLENKCYQQNRQSRADIKTFHVPP